MNKWCNLISLTSQTTRTCTITCYRTCPINSPHDRLTCGSNELVSHVSLYTNRAGSFALNYYTFRSPLLFRSFSIRHQLLLTLQLRDTRDDLMNLRVGGNRIKSIARWCHLQVAVWPGRIDIASASAWNAKYDTCPSWCQNRVRHRYTWLVAIRDGRDETWSTKDGLRMTGKMCTDSHDFLKWPMTRFRDIYLGFFVICLSLFFYFRTSNSSLDGMIGFQWCDD